MPLQGARGGDPPGGNRGNRRRGGDNTRVVTVVKSSNGIFKPSRGGGRGGGRGRGFGGRGRGGFQGRGGSRGRGGGRGRGRGRQDYSGPSFIPEGKRYNDLTDEEKEEVERQRNAWKAAQLDKDLINFMSEGGKGSATAMLDDDLENYKKQGAKQKKTQPQAAQPDQPAAEPMEQ